MTESLQTISVLCNSCKQRDQSAPGMALEQDWLIRSAVTVEMLSKLLSVPEVFLSCSQKHTLQKHFRVGEQVFSKPPSFARFSMGRGQVGFGKPS